MRPVLERGPECSERCGFHCACDVSILMKSWARDFKFLKKEYDALDIFTSSLDHLYAFPGDALPHGHDVPYSCHFYQTSPWPYHSSYDEEYALYP